MASWASIAKASPQPAVAAQNLSGSTDNLRLLVVDANAIISGLNLEGIADRAVTIQEVIEEIRDKQSRQFLANLPYTLQVSEPTEESVKAVTRFARETGDVAALSTNDIKVLALAYTLEAAAHGSSHLSPHASQPRMHSRAISGPAALPGWGAVSNPEDWKVVDEANEQDEAAAASTSRIAQHVQQLTLDPAQPDSFLAHESSSSPTAAAAGAPASKPMQQQAAAAAETLKPAAPQTAVANGTAAAVVQPAAAAPRETANCEEQYGGVDGGDDDWAVAGSSKNAERRKKRKQYKRQERQLAFEQEWEEHARLVQQQQVQQAPLLATATEPSQQQQDAEFAAGSSSTPQDDVHGDGSGSESEGKNEAAVGEDEQADVTNDELLAAEHQVYTTDEVDAAAHANAEAGDSSTEAVQQQQHADLAPGMPGWQSSVACITADFAMQNVLLQMGLRLLTRDGRRIARLSRYALRCSACFTVTREPGRIFCPKCGNMTLDRVEVVVGPDGAEYFGVKKRHILRGTKYSLPKPKGGRSSNDPVLREDVFLLKVKALGRRATKKKAAEQDDVDPFAPEFNQDTWHVQSQAELAQHRGLAAVLQPAWKKNPNERKLTRSNRRG